MPKIKGKVRQLENYTEKQQRLLKRNLIRLKLAREKLANAKTETSVNDAFAQLCWAVMGMDSLLDGDWYTKFQEVANKVLLKDATRKDLEEVLKELDHLDEG